MDISTPKVVLALAATWGVPAKNEDIPNAYVRAEKEAHLDICLQVPRGMTVSESTLRKVGAIHPGEVVLELRRSLYGLKKAGRLYRLADPSSTQRWRVRALRVIHVSVPQA